MITSPFPIVSEEREHVLLVLTPLLVCLPPIIETPQILCSMPNTTDEDLTLVEIARGTG